MATGFYGRNSSTCRLAWKAIELNRASRTRRGSDAR